MVDEDSVLSSNWWDLLAEPSFPGAGSKKKYLCKYLDCKRSFAHSQSRSRHYRCDHKEETTADKKDTGDDVPVTVNLISERDRLDVRNFGDQAVQNKASPQIKDVMSLCQTFFDTENDETAMELIKGSRMVQDNVLEMRNVIETIYNARNIASQRHQGEIRTLSQKLKEQMIVAKATEKYKVFEAVLDMVFESDRASIEYLTTFHSVLGLALQHTSLYSERVNLDIMRTRLLKRALGELVDVDTERTQKFSIFGPEKRPRCAHPPRSTNAFLCDSEDEATEPTRRFNSVPEKLSASEIEPDFVVKNAMRGTRRNFHDQRSFGDAEKDNDLDL